MMSRPTTAILAAIFCSFASIDAFSTTCSAFVAKGLAPASQKTAAPSLPPNIVSRSLLLKSARSKLQNSFEDDVDASMKEDHDSHTCWKPNLRKVLGAISAFGAVETGYLTYEKLFVTDGINHICGTGGGCGDVLDGPYATLMLGGMEIPLSALGFLAYTVVAALSVIPLFREHGVVSSSKGESNLDVSNRILLLSATTAMATFSLFLMSLLFGILHTTCPYCVVSAGLSLTLALLSWTSGMMPQRERRLGATSTLGSVAVTTVAALTFFFSVPEATLSTYTTQLAAASVSSPTDGMTLLASAKQPEKDIPPPAITTTSTERSLALASQLKSLDAKMYGAYWCSHCFEQKQRLGKEAMMQLPYVECAKEGLNSERDACKERDVPGYPTWEIGGRLYPGEQELDELEDIVKEVVEKNSKEAAKR